MIAQYHALEMTYERRRAGWQWLQCSQKNSLREVFGGGRLKENFSGANVSLAGAPPVVLIANWSLRLRSPERASPSRLLSPWPLHRPRQASPDVSDGRLRLLALALACSDTCSLSALRSLRFDRCRFFRAVNYNGFVQVQGQGRRLRPQLQRPMGQLGAYRPRVQYVPRHLQLLSSRLAAETLTKLYHSCLPERPRRRHLAALPQDRRE